MLAALYVEIRGATPKHYHIRQTPEGQYYLSDKHLFKSIPELIYYHKLNAGGRL
jgi:SH2 domain